jgi:uncharacterized membrane protein
MIPDPLHPAIVHFPIVLAVLLPFAAVVALLSIRRGAPARKVWPVLVVLAALLFGAAFVSVRTGEAQEERVEDVLASERPLHDHEESAERFLVLAGIVFALSPIGLLKGRAGVAGRVALGVGSLALVAAIWPVGTTGGELVYEHGAAQAYVGGTSAVGAGIAVRSGGSDHDEH